MQTTDEALAYFQVFFPGDDSICVFRVKFAGVVDVKSPRAFWD